MPGSVVGVTSSAAIGLRLARADRGSAARTRGSKPPVIDAPRPVPMPDTAQGHVPTELAPPVGFEPTTCGLEERRKLVPYGWLRPERLKRPGRSRRIHPVGNSWRIGTGVEKRGA